MPLSFNYNSYACSWIVSKLPGQQWKETSIFFKLKDRIKTNFKTQGGKKFQRMNTWGGGDTCNYEQIFSSNLESDCNLQYLN